MWSLVVYRLVHAPVTRESGVRLPAREFFSPFPCQLLTALSTRKPSTILRIWPLNYLNALVYHRRVYDYKATTSTRRSRRHSNEQLVANVTRHWRQSRRSKRCRGPLVGGALGYMEEARWNGNPNYIRMARLGLCMKLFGALMFEWVLMSY